MNASTAPAFVAYIISVHYIYFFALLCSYFLYTISHPDRYGAPIIDLSKDKEAQIVSNMTLTHVQTSIERVKVFSCVIYHWISLLTKYVLPSRQNSGEWGDAYPN